MKTSRSRGGFQTRPYVPKRGRLIVISAPSGAGKTTVVDKWIRRSPKLVRSVSYTTRFPRRGEKEGVDYHFLARAEFLRRRRRGFFLEWAKVFGQYYGTSQEDCLRLLAGGRNVVLTIDIQGMRKIKRRIGKRIPCVAIFLMPPSADVLKTRLLKRKTDRTSEIQKRLRAARREMRARHEYDFVVVNQEVGRAVRDLKRILRGKGKR